MFAYPCTDWFVNTALNKLQQGSARETQCLVRLGSAPEGYERHGELARFTSLDY